jgi:hypothetical protein
VGGCVWRWVCGCGVSLCVGVVAGVRVGASWVCELIGVCGAGRWLLVWRVAYSAELNEVERCGCVRCVVVLEVCALLWVLEALLAVVEGWRWVGLLSWDACGVQWIWRFRVPPGGRGRPGLPCDS